MDIDESDGFFRLDGRCGARVLKLPVQRLHLFRFHADTVVRHVENQVRLRDNFPGNCHLAAIARYPVEGVNHGIFHNGLQYKLGDRKGEQLRRQIRRKGNLVPETDALYGEVCLQMSQLIRQRNKILRL